MQWILSFDLYGTLVDWRYSIDRFIQRLLGSEEAVHEFFRCEFASIRSYRPYSSILSECLKHVCEVFNKAYREIYGESLVKAFSKSPPFPDTILGLNLLKDRGFKLMIISNTERRLIKVTLSGIEDLFDWVVTAEDLGVYKPDPRAFIEAYRLAEVDGLRDRVIHISAYPEYDLEPASRVGIKTILVNRYGKSWSPSFTDLVDLAENIDRALGTS